MRARTRDLWEGQDRHEGDRWRLFAAVAAEVDATSVLYPGSFVDVAASFVWPSVTYVDVDRRARLFFDDAEGVREIIAAHDAGAADHEVRFIAADYTDALDLAAGSFDLLVSLYAGFVSEWCTRYLRVGGTLLVNPSHGDAAMASIDDRYTLSGVVVSRDGGYRVLTNGLERYLVPKKQIDLTPEYLHDTGRGIGYTTSPFAYTFTRVR